MELMTRPALDGLRVSSGAPGWSDVVGEIVASCRRRATPGGLWQGEGAIAVTQGAGPIAWVYDAQDPAAFLSVLDSSPSIDAVYVSSEQIRIAQELAASGWSPGETVDHLLFEGRSAGDGDPRVVTVGSSDLPALRELLRRNGAPERLLASHYPDDFFEVCAPVRVLGIRADDGQLIGSVAVRSQLRSALGFALNVAPGARGRGLGRALVCAAADHAAGLGAAFIHAQSAGAAFLRSCGWTPVGSWVLMSRD